MIHNNPRNKIDGNRLKAAGMVAGVADLEYVRLGSPPLFIEMKRPGEKQSDKQIAWEKVALSTGARYVVCCSLEQFKQIITEAQN